MKRMVFFLCILLLCAAPALAATASGTLTFNVDLSAQPAGQEVKLWLPYPVSDANQTISNVRFGGDYAEAGVYTDNAYGTPMLYARWGADAKSRVLTFSFEAVAQGGPRATSPRRRVPGIPATMPASWRRPASARPTARSRSSPTRSPPARRRPRQGQGDLRLDRAKTCTATRKPAAAARGMSAPCCNRPGGKCADISSVFVALARAAGVPCPRGLRHPPRQGCRGRTSPAGSTAGPSSTCRATGWVPVDPGGRAQGDAGAEAGADGRQGPPNCAAISGAASIAYRVKLASGRDLVLNPPQAGGPLNYLMYPYAEVGGQAIDWLEPANFKYTITYRQ